MLPAFSLSYTLPLRLRWRLYFTRGVITPTMTTSLQEAFRATYIAACLLRDTRHLIYILPAYYYGLDDGTCHRHIR